MNSSRCRKDLEIKDLSTGIEMNENDQANSNDDSNLSENNVTDEDVGENLTLNEDGAIDELNSQTTDRPIIKNNAGIKKVIRTECDIKFACNQCDKQYSHQRHLTRHIQSVHEDVKYDCNQCDKQFKQQSSLTYHIQSIHEGVKYACN